MIYKINYLETRKENTILNNRFWEFYLVRYLSGSIFGVIILCYLIWNYDNEITAVFLNKDAQLQGHTVHSLINEVLFNTNTKITTTEGTTIKINDKAEIEIEGNPNANKFPSSNTFTVSKTELTVLSAIILGTSGFLFMYLSSMLILILHAFRNPIFQLLNKWRKPPLTWFKSLLFNNIYEFYYTLTNTRSLGNEDSLETLSNVPNKNAYIKEYVESYRHLREHGNAFGIIASEICFASWLILFKFSFFSILLWCMLGFAAWILGVALEIKLTRNQNN